MCGEMLTMGILYIGPDVLNVTSFRYQMDTWETWFSQGLCR